MGWGGGGMRGAKGRRAGRGGAGRQGQGAAVGREAHAPPASEADASGRLLLRALSCCLTLHCQQHPSFIAPSSAPHAQVIVRYQQEGPAYLVHALSCLTVYLYSALSGLLEYYGGRAAEMGAVLMGGLVWCGGVLCRALLGLLEYGGGRAGSALAQPAQHSPACSQHGKLGAACLSPLPPVRHRLSSAPPPLPHPPTSCPLPAPFPCLRRRCRLPSVGAQQPLRARPLVHV